MRFKNYIKLLALTFTPKTCRSILDWTPFQGGDTLNKIIDDHNASCLKCYKRTGLLPELVEKYVEESGEGISVDLRDLSKVDKLRSYDFAVIRILLFDLDSIGSETSELNIIRNLLLLSLGRQFQWYYLLQVSHSSGWASRASEFLGLPVLPTKPEILPNQDAFKDFLMRLCKAYQDNLIVLGQPPSPSLGTIGPTDKLASRIYRSAIRRMANEIRDATIVRDLSKTDAKNLARQVSLQEFTLARIAAQVRMQTGNQVIVDALREPVINMQIEPTIPFKDMRKVSLVTLQLNRTIRGLPAEQRKLLSDLGVEGKRFVAVHANREGIWNTLDSLKGTVNATKFSAVVPHGFKI